MLEKQFISAKIKGINSTSWKLRIFYSYYGVSNFDETFVYQSLNEAKTKLILERCHNQIQIIDDKDIEIKLLAGPG